MPLLSPAPETARVVRESGLRHVACIMDGNRRWARKNALPSLLGHERGLRTLKDLVRYAAALELEALTVYAFSTENWQRDRAEVEYLIALAHQTLGAELEEMRRNNVSIRFLGELSVFPPALGALARAARERTAGNTGLRLQIAANYGGRQELVRAARALARRARAGELEPEAIDAGLLGRELYTEGLPDPDLLIRTGGERRVSNWLLWQTAYAELFFTDTLWPDFTAGEFDAAVREFARRERRFGQ